MDTRIDHITDGIYRISTWTPTYRITFNQFLDLQAVAHHLRGREWTLGKEASERLPVHELHHEEIDL